jgi:anti-sigma factor RsiW
MESGDILMSSMNHEQAIQGQAAERYLLGELDGPEREAYEEHFFDCAACAEEVKAGAAFARAARDHFATAPFATKVPERKSPVLRPSWFNWRGLLRPAPAFAFCLLLLLSTATIYQNVVTIPRLRAPQVASVLFLTESRGGPVKAVTAPRHGLLDLQIDVPPAVAFAAYEGRIVDQSGKPKFSVPISAQQANTTVHIFVHADTLLEGRYVLMIDGVNSPAEDHGRTPGVAQYAFELRFQK